MHCFTQKNTRLTYILSIKNLTFCSKEVQAELIFKKHIYLSLHRFICSSNDEQTDICKHPLNV